MTACSSECRDPALVQHSKHASMQAAAHVALQQLQLSDPEFVELDEGTWRVPAACNAVHGHKLLSSGPVCFITKLEDDQQWCQCHRYLQEGWCPHLTAWPCTRT
jgi:hypothetical protein